MTKPNIPGAVWQRNPGLIIAGLGALMLAFLCCVLVLSAAGGYFLWLRGKAPTESPAMTTTQQALANINRIVYVDAAGRLRTIAPDGAEPRQLSSPELRFQFPAWSPDGAFIAAIGSDGEGGGVYVFEDDNSPPMRALYSSKVRPPFYLYWSPDSQKVSFLVNDASRLSLWVAPVGGEGAAEEVAFGQPFYWMWDPSGDAIFLHTGGSGPDSRVGFLALSDDRGVDNLARPGFFQAPGISPSGRYIAFAEAPRGESSRVVVKERDGSVRWEAPYRGVAALNWSPRQDTLAFISPPEDAPHFYGPLRMLDARDGVVRQLSTRAVVAFFWSPDGKQIAYLSPTNSADTDVSRRNAPVPAARQAQGRGPRLDLVLLDVASGEEHELVSFIPTPIFVSQFLPFFDQYALSHRLWSPHSDALVLPVIAENGEERIYVFPTSGALPPDPLAAGSIAFWSYQ